MSAPGQPGQDSFSNMQTQSTPSAVNSRKRRLSGQPVTPSPIAPAPSAAAAVAESSASAAASTAQDTPSQQPVKKSRTNTPWTPAEEQRLKQMRDVGNSWSEIAKAFPMRTEGSVKKHWYKDMHYAEFAEDEVGPSVVAVAPNRDEDYDDDENILTPAQSAALLAAIKQYDNDKWKVIGAKVGKPAKACEQYAKEHFGGKI